MCVIWAWVAGHDNCFSHFMLKVQGKQGIRRSHALSIRRGVITVMRGRIMLLSRLSCFERIMPSWVVFFEVRDKQGGIETHIARAHFSIKRSVVLDFLKTHVHYTLSLQVLHAGSEFNACNMAEVLTDGRSSYDRLSFQPSNTQAHVFLFCPCKFFCLP
jgi:hypothetical protein